MRRSILLAAVIMLVSTSARAAPARSGGQLEGMFGGAACIGGRVGCMREALPVTGRMQPSFGGGVGLGARPKPWIAIMASYRAGLFDPDYVDARGDVVEYVLQHTVAVGVRPILPVWRFDLGLDLGVGYSRQIVGYREQGRRDFTQGVSLIVGATIDVFITDHVFAGAGVNMLVNLHGTVCGRTSAMERCSRMLESVTFLPNHQVIFGLRVGTTFG